MFSIPFRFNNLGKIDTSTDGREVWRTRVNLVLSTKFGERVMRPDFGSELPTIPFENEGSAIEIGQRTINIAFNKWLSDLNLIDVVPKYDDYTGTMQFNIIYALPSGEQDSTYISTGVFNRTGDLIQEIARG